MVNSRRIVDFASVSRALEPGDKCLVGVSGGPDSVCLLLALHELRPVLGFELEVVHINHLVRGSEALEDYRFVSSLCEKLGVVCHYREIEPLSRKPRGVTLEEYFRKQRHASIFEVARRQGIGKIALGHNADDLSETFLMHLMRGTGLQGLAFHFSQRRGGLVLMRPLWQTPRQKILEYLGERQIAYREDMTNKLPEFTRNRVRHVLLPMLAREFNPSIGDALRRTSRVISLAEEYLRSVARRKLRSLLKRNGEPSSLPLRGFCSLPAVLQHEVAREWLRRACGRGRRPSFQQIESVVYLAHAAGARQAVLFEGMTVARAENRLVILRAGEAERKAGGEPQAANKLPAEELAMRYLDQNPCMPLAVISVPIAVESLEPSGVFETRITQIDGSELLIRLHVIQQPELACVEPVRSSQMLDFPLYLRNRSAGDRVSPSVRLKSVLINDKVPYYLRDFLMVVANAKGRIIAVAGMERINARLQSEWGVQLRLECRKG